jgi:hypothetical protein
MQKLDLYKRMDIEINEELFGGQPTRKVKRWWR